MAEVNSTLEQLDRETMKKFLYTFSEECEDNVEFQEFGNEMLFKALQKNPELFISLLNEESSILEIEEIIDQLGNPIHDQINLEEIQKIVSESNLDLNIKSQIVKALDSAIERSQ